MSQAIVLTDNQKKSFAKIIPEQGAMLAQLCLNGVEVIQSQVFDAERKIGFPSAFLFPFPNRIAEGKYTFQNQYYQLNMNEPTLNNALHGLVFGVSFDIIKQENHLLELIYKYRGEGAGFPFDFDLVVSFSFIEDCFTLKYTATNVGKTSMPAAFGWHPYFQLNGKCIDSLSLKIPDSERLALTENKIPSGEIVEYNIENIRIVNTFYDDIYKIQELKNKVNQIILSDGEIDLTIRHNSNSAENYWMIFTPSSRNCIAIEPQTANIDCFNNHQGLLELLPKEQLQGEILISLKKSTDK